MLTIFAGKPSFGLPPYKSKKIITIAQRTEIEIYTDLKNNSVFLEKKLESCK